MAARIRKGDRVVVISGDDKGKQGKVTRARVPVTSLFGLTDEEPSESEEEEPVSEPKE